MGPKFVNETNTKSKNVIINNIEEIYNNEILKRAQKDYYKWRSLPLVCVKILFDPLHNWFRQAIMEELPP